MNAQIGNEFGASLQYVNIAAYFDGVALPVAARPAPDFRGLIALARLEAPEAAAKRRLERNGAAAR